MNVGGLSLQLLHEKGRRKSAMERMILPWRTRAVGHWACDSRKRLTLAPDSKGETTTGRILRYWLQGPKMGEHEVFAQLPGFLDNINRNSKGEFWVALYCLDHQLGNFSFSNELRKGNCRSIIRQFNIVQPAWVDYYVIGVKLSEEGEIMELLFVDDGTIGNLRSFPKSEILKPGKKHPD
ncbi:hypothetical protein MRB53_011446 [Persea americana]|uniref:Uncharacterized protein n=1 Tax=Persea americana TaxID=3435 RepID=A0ACC2LUS7_PERAE|nr:hypothetical protein MRB53_011446 [Persea americana]